MTQTGNVFEAKKGFRFEAMFWHRLLKNRRVRTIFWRQNLLREFRTFSFIRFTIPVLQFYFHHSRKCKLPDKALMVHRVLRCAVYCFGPKFFLHTSLAKMIWLGSLLNSEQPHLNSATWEVHPLVWGIENRFWSLERHRSNSGSSLHVWANS